MADNNDTVAELSAECLKDIRNWIQDGHPLPGNTAFILQVAADELIKLQEENDNLHAHNRDVYEHNRDLLDQLDDLRAMFVPY